MIFIFTEGHAGNAPNSMADAAAKAHLRSRVTSAYEMDLARHVTNRFYSTPASYQSLHTYMICTKHTLITTHTLIIIDLTDSTIPVDPTRSPQMPPTRVSARVPVRESIEELQRRYLDGDKQPLENVFRAFHLIQVSDDSTVFLHLPTLAQQTALAPPNRTRASLSRSRPILSSALAASTASHLVRGFGRRSTGSRRRTSTRTGAVGASTTTSSFQPGTVATCSTSN